MKEGTFENTYREIEEKKDCRFYNEYAHSEHKKPICSALKELYCRMEKCKFYKPCRKK
jgi:hypothetical protein